MNPVNYREYNNQDKSFVIAGLCEIEKLERDQTTSLIVADDFPQKIALWVDNIDASPSNLIIILEKHAKACGFIIAIVESQPNHFTQFNMHGLIQALWIDPSQRNKGLAAALVKQALDSFAEYKIPYCDIAYHPQNQPAKKFWAKMGFTNAQITSRKFLGIKPEA